MRVTRSRAGYRCVLAPLLFISLLFNICFTAVLRVTGKRFIYGAAIIDGVVQVQRNKDTGRQSRRIMVGEGGSDGMVR